MSESSGPGEVSAPSRESGAQGPACDGSALPDLGELRRLAEAATPGPWGVYIVNAREAYVGPGMDALHPADKADACLFKSYGEPGNATAANAAYIAATHPQAVLALLGRLTELEAAADALAGACEAAAHSGYSATSRKVACPLCGFHPDEHAAATEECLIAAALAAYRAVRSTTRKEG